jgi:putative transposase
MSRPLRVIKQNVTYHCYSRCIENRRMLKNDLTKEIVIHSIKKALGKYRFNLSYIEFVDNHVHIIIKTLNGGAAIPEIMQYIKARITRIYNQKHKRIGTLWNERYKSEIIEDYSYPEKMFIRLIIDLSYNPVRKGLFENPRENPYSSLQIYLDDTNKKGIPLMLHEYYICLGSNSCERKKTFEVFEQAYLQKQ